MAKTSSTGVAWAGAVSERGKARAAAAATATALRKDKRMKLLQETEGEQDRPPRSRLLERTSFADMRLEPTILVPLRLAVAVADLEAALVGTTPSHATART
ncbi:hypothetical protein GCM10018965_066750 [Nonomuraea roseola]